MWYELKWNFANAFAKIFALVSLNLVLISLFAGMTVLADLRLVREYLPFAEDRCLTFGLLPAAILCCWRATVVWKRDPYDGSYGRIYHVLLWFLLAAGCLAIAASRIELLTAV